MLLLVRFGQAGGRGWRVGSCMGPCSQEQEPVRIRLRLAVIWPLRQMGGAWAWRVAQIGDRGIKPAMDRSPSVSVEQERLRIVLQPLPCTLSPISSRGARPSTTLAGCQVTRQLCSFVFPFCRLGARSCEAAA